MYRNVPTLLINFGTKNKGYISGVMGLIDRVNWAITEPPTDTNGYVEELLLQFKEIQKVLLSFKTLPRFIHNRLNIEAILYVQELMVYAYSDSKKCTLEGRSLMMLDQKEFQKGLKEILIQQDLVGFGNNGDNNNNNNILPNWKYMDNFLQAFYLSKDELIEWCQKHIEYPIKVINHLVKNGQGQINLTKKEKNELIIQATDAYRKGVTMKNKTVTRNKMTGQS